MAEKAKALFYDGPDRMIWVRSHPGSRCCVLRSDALPYLCSRASKSKKFSGQELKEIRRHIGSLETPKQVRIPPIMNCYGSEKIADHTIVSV